jgi:hypothetical protein
MSKGMEVDGSRRFKGVRSHSGEMGTYMELRDIWQRGERVEDTEFLGLRFKAFTHEHKETTGGGVRESTRSEDRLQG